MISLINICMAGKIVWMIYNSYDNYDDYDDFENYEEFFEDELPYYYQ